MNLTTSITATAIPVEDLADGMCVPPAQRRDPHPDRVFAAARTGLSASKVGALFGMDFRTVAFHFPRTIAQAHAELAQELLQRVCEKAFDQDIKGDMKAIELLLKRVDPEPKEAPITIQQQINIGEQLKNVTVDQLNNLLTGESHE